VKTREIFTAMLVLLLAAALVWPAAAASGAEAAGQYKLTYRTAPGDGFAKSFAATALAGENKIVVAACYTEGGCISAEELTVKAAGRGEDGATVVDLLLTLDGSPCKGMFARKLQAVLETPAPGPYRVRLWLKQLYYGDGERLLGQQDVAVGKERTAGVCGADGFLGLAWGTKPEQVAGLRPVLWMLPFDAFRTAGLGGGQAFFGDAAEYMLVFAPGEGLVRGRVEVDTARWPEEGRREFLRCLGAQLLIEPAPGKAALPTWHVGGNTRVVQTDWGGKTVYVFSRRDFAGLPAIEDRPAE
jgi:hypothetical protein